LKRLSAAAWIDGVTFICGTSNSFATSILRRGLLWAAR
jgi:hypothetical protein